MSETAKRYDFHVHSKHSYDCLVGPETIIRAAKARGLAGIAVTDHETIAGALAVRAVTPADLLLIVGQEVYTDIGDIVCLGLTTEIRSRDALAVIAEAHRQGGVAFLPHPLRSHPGRIPDEVLDAVDGYEGLNSRAGCFDVGAAQPSETNWARLAGKAVLGNSDAHFASDIGRAYTLMTGPATFDNVRAAILERRTATGGTQSPVTSFYGSQFVRMIKTRDPALLLRLARKVARRILCREG